MAADRRTFIKTVSAVGGALSLGFRRRPIEKAPAPLNILILGGTGFTGPERGGQGDEDGQVAYVGSFRTSAFCFLPSA